MARYITKVRTDRSVEDAFAYMADMRNVADWDPGVRAVDQVDGDGPGLDRAFDVTVAAVGPDLTLRYRTADYQPPGRVLLVARSSVFTSIDLITVESDGAGSIVTYDAELTLNGVLAVADLALRPIFGRIGDRAAAGLRAALDGTVVAR